MRLQQRVQPATRGRGLRKEDITAWTHTHNSPHTRRRTQAHIGTMSQGQSWRAGERGTVEVEHVLDPVGVGEGGATGNGHSVEDAHGVLAVVDQRVEERRLEPGLYALQDREVQLLEEEENGGANGKRVCELGVKLACMARAHLCVVGLVVEDAAELIVVGEGHPLHRQIAEAEDVQLGPCGHMMHSIYNLSTELRLLKL